MSSRARSGLLVVTILVIAVGGFFAGTRLGERASQAGTQTLTLDRPSASAPRDVALQSAAGFSGFEEGALGGLVMRSGTAEIGEEGTVVVQSGPARLQVRTLSPARLFRIVAADSPLAPGDVVVVRVDEDGVADGVLRVPADLREGDSR